MPRRKFIDKKNATTFQVLHRPQHDPRVHDESTPSVVFQETSAQPASSSSSSSSPQSQWLPPPDAATSRFTTLDELASQYGGSSRGNEGEAAQHGVYFDDTDYDYMKHLRDLGTGGASHWVESTSRQSKRDGKRRQDLADALRDMDIESSSRTPGADLDDDNEAPSLVPASIPADSSSAYSFPSWASEKSHTDRVVESQLSVPSAISGFQPDMDLRLREALEALNDDAYVDAVDEDDMFGELSGDGVEVDLDEFERLGDMIMDEDERAWESDDTVKAFESSRQSADSRTGGGGVQLPLEQHPADSGATPGEDEARTEDGAWLSEFSKFKRDQKLAPAEVAPPSTLLTGASSSLYDLPAPMRKKKRKGALTETSSYSMTSSSLFRNDNQTLLDARFDKFEADYSADITEEGEADDGVSVTSDMTGASRVSALSSMSGFSSASRASAVSQQPKSLRSDFDSIMDDFLGDSGRSTTAAASTRRMGARGNSRNGAGLKQLDEIRKGLGPARVSNSAQRA